IAGCNRGSLTMARVRRIVALGLLVWLAAGISLAADETGFKRLFNGKELKGWQAADMTCWTVEDGAITGRAAADTGRATDQYLVWQYGEVDDFELKFSHRQAGTSKGQGGV